MVDQYFLEMFKEQIELNIEDYVEKKCSIRVEQVDKNNITMTALSILPEGSFVGTVIYVDPYYEASRQQVTTQTLVKMAVESIKKGIEDTPTVDMDMIRDYEQVKGRLSVDLMSADNTKILKNVPHQLFEDMAAVYRINLDDEKISGTVLITNQMLETYGITQEQLHEDAINNAAVIKPVVISDMNDVLSEVRDTEDIDPLEIVPYGYLYVATVPDKHKGAGVLAYKNFFEEAARKLDGDFFVIPSSIHEVLLLKDLGQTNYRELEVLVKMVNDTDVRPEDRLTNSVYHYDSKNKIFELGEKYSRAGYRRRTTRKKEKCSVLDDLKEKQSCVKVSVDAQGKVSFVDRGGTTL